MSQQMKSIFDFERICINCKFAESPSGCRYDYDCCKPNTFVEIDDERKDTCDDWKSNQEYAPLYLVDEQEKILKRTNA